MGHIILSFVDLKILRGSRKRGMSFSQKKELACQFVIILERDEITFHQERKSTFQKKLNLSLSIFSKITWLNIFIFIYIKILTTIFFFLFSLLQKSKLRDMAVSSPRINY